MVVPQETIVGNMNALVTPYQGALTIVGIDLNPHLAVRVEGLHEPGFSGVLRPSTL